MMPFKNLTCDDEIENCENIFCHDENVFYSLDVGGSDPSVLLKFEETDYGICLMDGLISEILTLDMLVKIVGDRLLYVPHDAARGLRGCRLTDLLSERGVEYRILLRKPVKPQLNFLLTKIDSGEIKYSLGAPTSVTQSICKYEFGNHQTSHAGDSFRYGAIGFFSFPRLLQHKTGRTKWRSTRRGFKKF